MSNVLVEIVLTTTRYYALSDYYVDGYQYRGQLVQPVKLELSLPDVWYGVEESRSVTVSLADDRTDSWHDIVAGEEIRGAQVIFRDEDRAFIASGKITEYKLDLQMDITVDLQDDETFDSLLPRHVVTPGDFTATAVNAGVPIPLCFGWCKNVPLANIQNNLADDHYDYLIGYGTVESLWVDHPNGYGVKRDGVLVDTAEYTFYDGSQASPYNGFAFIRFTVEQKDFRGNFHNLTADVKGLELGGASAERNFATVIESILSDSTWGLGESVNATSFSDAATALADWKCDGAVFEQMAVRDIVNDMLFACRSRLYRDTDNKWCIAVDGTGSSVATFGEHDGYYNNCDITSVSFANADQAPKKIIFRYDRYEISLNVHSGFGVEKSYASPFVVDLTTAKKILSYLYGRAYYADKSLTMKAGSEAKDLEPGDVITIISDRCGLASELYRVTSITKDLVEYEVQCEAYNASIFDAQVISDPTEQTGTYATHALKTIDSGYVGGMLVSADTIATTDGLVGLTSVVTGGTDWRIWAGNVDPASAPFRVDETGEVWMTAAHVTGAIEGGTIDIGGLDTTSFHVDINGNMWLGHADYASAPFTVSSTGALTATSGTIGGWILGTDLLKSAASGARIELDQAKKRISVIDATEASKVVMGYLNGLARNDGGGNWGAGDYGFWAADGDRLRIDGDTTYESGDWIVENDGSLLINNASDQTIIRLGTDTGEKGLFLYNAAGTNLAKYVTDEIYLGESGEAANYLKYTVADGLEIAGKITIAEGSGYSNLSDVPIFPSDDGLVGYWNMDGNTSDAVVDTSGRGMDGTPTYDLCQYIPDLVAHWPLHQVSGTTAYDLSGNENHGTLTNGASWSTGGKVWRDCIAFDRTLNQYISVPDDIIDLAKDFSLAFWIYPINEGAGAHRVAMNLKTGTDLFQIYYYDNGRVCFSHYINSVQTGLYSGTGYYSADTWNHFVVVYESGTISIYVNGSYVPTTSPTANLHSLNSGIGIGPSPGGTHGKIDDVRIYRRALTTDQITDLYTNYRGGYVEGVSGMGLNVPNPGNAILCGSPLIGPAFTYACWYKPGTGDSAHGLITNLDHTPDCYGTSLYQNGPHLRVASGDGAGNRPTDVWSSVFTDIGVWYHVAAVYDGTKYTLYVNGQASPTTYTRTVAQNSTPIYIGRWASSYSTDYPTSGVIDDARVYNRALSAQEILGLYAWPGGRQATVIGPTQISTTSLSAISANIGTVTTGVLQSTNWAAGAGAQIDLTNQTIKFGGSSAPKFSVAADGSIAATSGTIGGWTIGSTALANSTNIVLDSSNKKITINNATFANKGIQLEYNAGNPRFYVGDGSSNFLKWDGTTLSSTYNGIVNMKAQGFAWVTFLYDEDIADDETAKVPFNVLIDKTGSEFNTTTNTYTAAQAGKVFIHVHITLEEVLDNEVILEIQVKVGSVTKLYSHAHFVSDT